MNSQRDPDALVDFLAHLRHDWNLGAIATELAREPARSKSWPQLVVDTVTLAVNDPTAPAGALRTAGAAG